MVFNGDSDNQDLCTLADKQVKTDDTDFPLEDKALYASMGERLVMAWIFSVYGGWIYDSSGNTDFPSATSTLTANQVDYTLPDLMDLKGVSIKLNGSSTWNKLTAITLEEIQGMGYAESEFERIASQPLYYRPLGNSVKIYPAANYTQAASIEVQFTRNSVGFASTSTTKTPGFASMFHEAIATFMAMKYAEVNTLDSAVTLRRDWDGNEEVTKIEGGYKKAIKKWYADRFAEVKPRIKGSRSDFVGQFV